MKSLKTLSLMACIALAMPLVAQNRAQGGIDADMLRQISASSQQNAA